MPYKGQNRAMALLVQPLLADALVGGIATLSLAVVSYLIWLYFHEGREQRKFEQERTRDRREHWGYG